MSNFNDLNILILVTLDSLILLIFDVASPADFPTNALAASSASLKFPHTLFHTNELFSHGS